MQDHERYDTIVAGLGVMGCSAALALAEAGGRVLGIDRFEPPHAFGSSSGETRSIRKAYFEHPRYVPLVEESYRLWREIEALAGESLLTTTGALMIGPRRGVLVEGALDSARTHGLTHELLDPAALAERYGDFRVEAGEYGLLEPEAGVLRAERSVEALWRLAKRAGAEALIGERVLSWHAEAGGVRVETEHGRHHARSLVVAAGPWTAFLVPSLSLRVERVLQHWFEPVRRASSGEAPWPIFIWEYGPERYWYGFPDLSAKGAPPGIKAALHYQGRAVDPDTLDREVKPAEIETVRRLIDRFLLDTVGAHLRSSVCMYTNTGDGHFVVDHHPEDDRVVVLSPCSGHGFKFAPVIGRMAAALARGEEPPLDRDLFRWR